MTTKAQLLVLIALVAALVGGSNAAGTEPGDLTIVAHADSEVSLSYDGSKIAFSARDLNRSVVVKDLSSGTTTLAASRQDGTPANEQSHQPSLSADGSRLSFASGASNLDPVAQGGGLRIFAKDLSDGSVQGISMDANGNFGSADFASAMSGNGERVAFTATQPLVPSDTNGRADVYVKDLVSGTLILASSNLPADKTYGSFYSVSISDDGNKVMYGAAPEFVGPSTPPPDLILSDLSSGTVSIVTTPDTTGAPNVARISGDGAHAAVAWAIPGERVRLWALDLASGDATIASTADDGTEAEDGFGINWLSISTDGQRIAFQSEDTNLDSADNDAVRDIYVKDIATGDLQLASVTAGGVKGNDGLSFGNGGGAQLPELSGDGTRLAFVSNATNLGATVSNSFEYYLYVKELAAFATPPDPEPCDITQDHSIRSDTPVDLSFVNDTDATVEVYWLAFNGDRIEWYTLGPGESLDQPTFLTHPWLVLDAESGECVGYTLAFDGEYHITSSVEPPADSDGDGLLDSWETSGIDADGDGNVDLPLHQSPFNADPDHKDLFLEVDYMPAHRPQVGVLADVTTAFANAPVGNPDGSSGVRLHALLDEDVTTVAPVCFWDCDTFPAPASFNDLKSGDTDVSCDGFFGTSAERSAANCDAALAARRLAFRYAIFAHSFSETPGSSGVGEMSGNDLMVTLGGKTAEWITAAGGLRTAEAGTLMHELGHTLSLRHGGDDELNCKPNYQSVMSYTRQVPNLDVARPLDFSRAQLATLLEGNLNEAASIGAAPGSVIFGRAGVPQVVPAGGAVDWSGNGVISGGVSSDINYVLRADGTPLCHPAPGQTLVGHDDWSVLEYNFRGSPDYADGVADPPREAPPLELTAQAALETAKLADSDRDGVSNAVENVCGVTRSYVEGSPKYASSKPQQRTSASSLVTSACKQLERIAPSTKPSVKSSAIREYKKIVDELRAANWLTPAQAAQLKGLADSL